MGIDLVSIFGILDSPKEKLAILFAEVVEAGDPITELVDDVDGGGEERVELGDAGSLPGNHPRLAVQLLLGQVRVLQQSFMSRGRAKQSCKLIHLSRKCESALQVHPVLCINPLPIKDAHVSFIELR